MDPNGESPIDIGFFIADSIHFGIALYSGNPAAIQSAGMDFAASALGLASPVPGMGQALKIARTADRINDAAKVIKNEKLLLGRSKSVQERVARAQGKASVVDSTDPKTIFKKNYSDMRKAKEIEFDARGVPKSLDDIIADPPHQGQFSRAERFIIDTRPDIFKKTRIIEE